MKKLNRCSRLLCLLLSVIFAVTVFVGCGGNESNKEVDLTNAPDYSSSTDEFTLFAYNPICDDWYQRNGVRYNLDGTAYTGDGTSLATPEELQKYKDAGFNYLFVDWVFQEHVASQDYDFEKGRLIKIMDMAHDVGLKCVVFQPQLHGLSSYKESVINAEKAAIEGNENKFFATQEDLNEYVAWVLTGLKDHPAFDGVSIIDEPHHLMFQAISEVYKAVTAAAPDAFVMLNLLPYTESNMHLDLYCSTATTNHQEAYKMYLDEYYEKVGRDMGYVMYDDYPILEGGVLPTFFYNNQVISDFCEEKDLERITLYQSCVYNDRRYVKEADVYYQMNVGMAFGNKTFGYYTYYPLLNTASESTPDDDAFVNYEGEPTEIYYAMQKVATEMQFNAKALMNFEYKGMQYKYKLPVNSLGYTTKLVNDEFELLKGFTFDVKVQAGGVVLVTELYDQANERYGYYVMNMTDPQFTSEAIVDLDFGSYDYAQVYQFGQVTNICTKKGKVKLSLGTGRGAFVMPF